LREFTFVRGWIRGGHVDVTACIGARFAFGHLTPSDYRKGVEREGRSPTGVPELTSRELPRKLAISVGLYGAGRRPSTRFSRKSSREASMVMRARDLSRPVTLPACRT
jgi:hypothetical protein